MKGLLLALALLPAVAAAPPDPAVALVADVESALWDDHADVRDACFLLRRAGIDSAELVKTLTPLAADGPAPLRRRARRLLARLTCAPRARCRARATPRCP